MRQFTAVVGDVCSIITKGTTPTTLGMQFQPNGVPFLRAQNVSGGKLVLDNELLFIDEQTHKALRRSAILPGDVLLTIAGTIGRAAEVPEDAPAEMNCNQAVAILRVTDEVDRTYMRHWLESVDAQRQIYGATVTGTISNLSLGQIRSLQIPLPPLDEQRRIAAILDKADALRAKRRQAIALLDSLTQSIFLEMFGTSASSTWPKVTINEVARDIRTGPFGSQLLHSEFVDDGIAVLGIDNAVNNLFEWGKARFITEEKYQQLSRYTVRPGDVLITIMGTCGRCAVVPDDIRLAINTKHLCCITLDKSRVLPDYLHSCFLNNRDVLQQMGVQAKGAVMPGLNMGIIKSLSIPVPPIGLQLAFKEQLGSLAQRLGSAEIAANRSEQLFASLQHRAFTGQL